MLGVLWQYVRIPACHTLCPPRAPPITLCLHWLCRAAGAFGDLAGQQALASQLAAGDAVAEAFGVLQSHSQPLPDLNYTAGQQQAQQQFAAMQQGSYPPPSMAAPGEHCCSNGTVSHSGAASAAAAAAARGESDAAAR